MARATTTRPSGGESDQHEAAETAMAAEAVLFATVCMVGLTVEVQLKDGSVYSGVFHTAACVRSGYGVVLKKARKIGKGKDGMNVAIGAFIDTLVVLPGDLVQVVVQDFELPSKGIVGRIPGSDVETANGDVEPQPSNMKNTESSTCEDVCLSSRVDQCRGKESPSNPEKVENVVNMALDGPEMPAGGVENMVGNKNQNCKSSEKAEGLRDLECSSVQRRQVEKCGELDQEHKVPMAKTKIQLNRKATSYDSSNSRVSSSATLGSPESANSVSSSSTLASDIRGFPPSHSSTAKINIPGKTVAKESKLNPSAKVFSPSFASFRPAPAAPPTVSTNYISNTFPEVPSVAPIFDINSLPSCSSLNTKVIPYSNNLASGNCGIEPPYVQPIMGNNATRLGLVRVGAQYQPLQVGTTYLSANPQPVMAGKFGPVVYVHPVSQDAIRGTPVISQEWSRPMLMNPYEASIQKFQAAAPVYVAPPIIATRNQPLVVQNPAPFLQPFPALRPVMVPVGSGMLPNKYL